jgi:hypothetical protein
VRGRRLLAGLVALGALVSCSSSTDSSDESTTTTAAEPPASLPVSKPGTGSIAIGAAVSTFAVTACSPSGEPPDAQGNHVVFGLAGKGTTKAGVDFTVTLRRLETPGDQATFDDEVAYIDTARIYQAQRVESGGTITDVRAPKATAPMLVISMGHVAGKGRMAPPGDTGIDAKGHDFTIPLLIDATCA